MATYLHHAGSFETAMPVESPTAEEIVQAVGRTVWHMCTSRVTRGLVVLAGTVGSLFYIGDKALDAQSIDPEGLEWCYPSAVDPTGTASGEYARQIAVQANEGNTAGLPSPNQGSAMCGLAKLLAPHGPTAKP